MFRSVILNFQTFSNCGNESCSVDYCFPNFVVMEPHLTAWNSRAWPLWRGFPVCGYWS